MQRERPLLRGEMNGFVEVSRVEVTASPHGSSEAG